VAAEARVSLADAMPMPKILTIDIETRPASGYFFGGLYDINMGLVQLIDPGGTTCWAAKWYGDKRVHFMSDYHDGHADMVRGAWEMMNEADIIIHFNGKAFDVKHLHREFILAGLGPPKPHRDIDLLTVVRSRAKFISNKLDNVATELGVGSKVKHPGFELWRRCIDNDPKAWALMKRYNIGDVRLTERVYIALRPWIKNHPHMGLYTGKSSCCPNCGSDKMVADGTITTPVSEYNALICQDCGAHARTPWRTATTLTRPV
jgi:DNA polymerase elongation subunit (family B)